MLADARDRADARFHAGDVEWRNHRVERAGRRIDLAPAVARFQLRVVPELLHGVEARVGDAGRLKLFHHTGGGHAGKHGLDQRVHFGAVLVPEAARGIARVLRQVGLAEHLGAEARELALVLDAEEYGLAIARPERTVGHDGRVERAGARRRRAAVVGEVGREAQPLAERLEHRDVERRAFVGVLAPEQRREDARERVHTRGDIRDRDAGLRGLLGRAGHRQQAGLALHKQVIGALGAVGAVLAVTGDPAPDEARVFCAQLLGAQAQPRGCTGRDVLHEHVGARDEFREDLFRLRVLGVEGHAFLGTVHPDEMRRQALDRGVVAARGVADARPLDLDHAGAELGQLARGERRGDDLLQRHDGDAREGKRCLERRLIQSAPPGRGTLRRRTRSPRFRPGPPVRHRSWCPC